jgi:pyruvate dehydrogenase E1 component beta subunit
VVADGGWRSFGWAAEVMAVVSEQGFNYLKAPIKRITLPDCPAPASQVLEKAYYPSAENIMDEIKKAIGAV